MTTTDPSTQDATNETNEQDFLVLLAGLDKGRAARKLDEKLRELMKAVDLTGKGGRIQLTINVKPVAKTDGMVTASYQVAGKLPEAEPKESVFFVGPDHTLHTDNPRQSSLPFEN